MAEVSRWGPIAGFVLVSSANQMLWLNFAPITTGTAARLGVSSSTVGLLSEVFPLLYVILAIPLGRALDRWFGPTLLVGAVLTGGGAALRLVGSGFAPLLVGQVVVAIGQPAVFNAVTGIATRSLRPEDRPTGIAIGSAGTFLGFVEAFVLGLVLGSAHLHEVLVVSASYAGVGLAVLTAQLARLRVRARATQLLADSVARPARATRDSAARPAGDSATRATGDSVVAAGHPAVLPLGGSVGLEDGSVGASLRKLWGDPVMRAIAALVFVGFGAFVALTTWLQTLLQPTGLGARTADRLLVVMVLAGIVSCVALPPLVAKRHAQPLVLALAAVGGLAGFLLLATDPSVVTGYVALGLIGLVLLPLLPVLLELIEARMGEHAGTATALLWLAGNAGGIVVALLVQATVHHPGRAFGLLAGFALAALPLAACLRAALRR